MDKNDIFIIDIKDVGIVLQEILNRQKVRFLLTHNYENYWKCTSDCMFFNQEEPPIRNYDDYINNIKPLKKKNSKGEKEVNVALSLFCDKLCSKESDNNFSKWFRQFKKERLKKNGAFRSTK